MNYTFTISTLRILRTYRYTTFKFLLDLGCPGIGKSGKDTSIGTKHLGFLLGRFKHYFELSQFEEKKVSSFCLLLKTEKHKLLRVGLSPKTLDQRTFDKCHKCLTKKCSTKKYTVAERYGFCKEISCLATLEIILMKLF